MKILYLKGYKWLLSQNQRVRNDLFGYAWYEAVTKHIKPFLKNIKVKGHQYQDYKVTQSTTNITDKKKWVINISSRQLTLIETSLLAKGLNFSITSKTLPNKDIIATIEDAVKDYQKEEADTIRAKISLTLQNSKPPKDNLFNDEHKALKELQSDTSIVTLPADKGRDALLSLMLRTIWKRHMDHINNGLYQLFKKNPTTKIKAKTLKQLKVLKDNEFIDNKFYYYLKPIDSPVARFHGQPKIHKPGVPICPIV